LELGSENAEGGKRIIKKNGIKEKPGWVAAGFFCVIISIGPISQI
jgi:hypothetical protein